MIALCRVTVTLANHLSDCKNLNVFKCYIILSFWIWLLSTEYKVPVELPDRAKQNKAKKIPVLLSPLPFLQLPSSYSSWAEKLRQTVQGKYSIQSNSDIQFRVNYSKQIYSEICHLKNWWGTGTAQGDITILCSCPPPFPSTGITFQFLGWESPQNYIQGKY